MDFNVFGLYLAPSPYDPRTIPVRSPYDSLDSRCVLKKFSSISLNSNDLSETSCCSAVLLLLLLLLLLLTLLSEFEAGRR